MGINVFWDNSNIWLVGRKVCEQIEPGEEQQFRIHFAHILDYVLDGREVEYAYLGGSVPTDKDALWNRFESLGVTVDKQERGVESGGEVAVDEAIQLAMANRILDAEEPGTIVLLTGDGNGYSEGKGFIKQLERAKKHGWSVEVVSWDKGCNNRLKYFAETNGIYRALEPAYMHVSFIVNKRWATRS